MYGTILPATKGCFIPAKPKIICIYSLLVTYSRWTFIGCSYALSMGLMYVLCLLGYTLSQKNIFYDSTMLVILVVALPKLLWLDYLHSAHII